MKGRKITDLSRFDGKAVWVEFESPDSASCENCGACGTAQLINSAYRDGIYTVQGQSLDPADGGHRLNLFNPRIVAVYEWR